ncbi:hypothetical protein [Nitrosospira sp. Nsp13]|uniref:hypothetical protein n=1 Tax=Nitrosospira sp. Nsp13 TaxID=1855332 RepID=UPI0011131EE5|nr:hypothetical protein [Nitrosospira sp. Nsp13]
MSRPLKTVDLLLMWMIPFQILFSVNNALAQSLTPQADPPSYGYHPSSSLSLGRGFLPRDIRLPMKSCIEADIVKLDSGPSSTIFSVLQVSSYDELASAVNFEAKGEGRYLAAGGSAYFKLNRSVFSQQNSVTIVVNATTDFGKWGLGPSHLSAEALALLPKPLEFAKTCGTKFVAIERRAASASIVITIFNASTELRTAMNTGGSVSGGGGAVSASASASFFDELKRASSQGRVSVQALATGGAGYSALSSIAENIPTQSKNLDGLYKGIGDYMKSFSDKNAAPYYFVVQSMDQFKFDPSKIEPWDQYRENQLNIMANAYHKLSEQIANAENWLGGGPLRQAKIVPNGYENDLKKWVSFAKEYLNTIMAKHEECLRKDGPNVCAFTQSQLIFRDDLEPVKLFSSSFSLTPGRCQENNADAPATAPCSWTGAIRPRLPEIKGRQAIAILNAANDSDALFAVLKNYNFRAGTFLATFDVQTYDILVDTYQYVFLDDDGLSEVSFELPEYGGIWMYAFRDESLDSNSVYHMLRSWMRDGNGNFSGTFLLRVRDKLGRITLLPLIDASWTSDKVNLKVKKVSHY